MSTSPARAARADHLAARLARAVHAGTHGPVLALVPAGPHAEVLVAPLEGRHPLELLWGRRAPGCWVALVVVATGSVVAAAPAAIGPRVVAATVTARTGPDRSLVLDERGRTVLGGAAVAEGLVPDATRRVLGRRTPPPDRPVATWWAMDWLDELERAVSGAPRPLSLGEALAHHPAVDPDELGGPAEELVPWLVQRGRDHAHLTGWEGVRRSVADGLLATAACPPDLAGWFDSGSFSRYALAVRPPPLAQLSRLAPALGGQLAATLDGVLRAWGVDHRW